VHKFIHDGLTKFSYSNAFIGSKIGTYMKKWIKNQIIRVEFLDEKFNKVLEPGKSLLGFDTHTFPCVTKIFKFALN
jgi:hypothetical protein